MKNQTEYTLRNCIGKIVTIAPLDLCFRYVKHNCPDGDYSIEGPNTNLILQRHQGFVYPTGGRLNDQEIPPQTLLEAMVRCGTGLRNAGGESNE
jgi:hypothetical protein